LKSIRNFFGELYQKVLDQTNPFAARMGDKSAMRPFGLKTSPAPPKRRF